MSPLSNIASWVNSPGLNWSQIIISLSTAKFIFMSYMNIRQLGVLQRGKPPKTLEAEAMQAAYDKSRAYSLDKIKCSIAFDIWLYCDSLIYIKFNVYLALWQASAYASSVLPGSAKGEITQSVLLAAIELLAHNLIILPFMYYRDFYLEEKHDFNNSTSSQWLIDKSKESLILLVIHSALIAGTLKVVELAEDLFIWYTWLFISIFIIVVGTLYPYLILPLFYKSKPLGLGKLKDSIDSLAHKNGFPLANVNVVNGSKTSSHTSAFFTGFPWSKHIFLYDTMVDKFEVEETTAVLAHEIGHWALNHMLIQSVYLQLRVLLILSAFSLFYRNPYLYSSFGFNHTPVYVKFGIFCYILTPMNCALQFMSNVLSRKHEYEADAYAVNQSYREHTATALVKNYKNNGGVLDAHWLYSAYHHSHPLLHERLQAIKQVSHKIK
ncbi:hypothetical protein BABINDRAFT_176275 [Babjeviella inositovora NRRL Y-12698]|uniref:CAAX prenyl protease n=1 Tax=Babjeviella inositovora NRRL Y-12698 TaxID=984486 RepID=A0A1E3QNS8_9ASCO|nr:uncharacterized protein BABINDRAFT_176275 [Babjeviella inositovora NRRL Y-12698]ODQ79359.1 hypothetical protein BABINDRAFT_176275 [Babjeviella inositovora NRRL Y-12698]